MINYIDNGFLNKKFAYRKKKSSDVIFEVKSNGVVIGVESSEVLFGQYKGCRF